MSTLQDDDFQTRFGKIARARQTVVPTADDGNIVSFAHNRKILADVRRKQIAKAIEL